MSRCLIPIDENYYLILNMDFDQYDFDKIIIEKNYLRVRSSLKKKTNIMMLI